jgi:hypothetical protein
MSARGNMQNRYGCLAVWGDRFRDDSSWDVQRPPPHFQSFRAVCWGARICRASDKINTAFIGVGSQACA